MLVLPRIQELYGVGHQWCDCLKGRGQRICDNIDTCDNGRRVSKCLSEISWRHLWTTPTYGIFLHWNTKYCSFVKRCHGKWSLNLMRSNDFLLNNLSKLKKVGSGIKQFSIFRSRFLSNNYWSQSYQTLFIFVFQFSLLSLRVCSKQNKVWVLYNG